jgi:hypothetical protein
VVASLAGAPERAAAQSSDHAAHTTLTAQRVTQAVQLDGRLAEEDWAQAPAAAGFTQRDPDEGRPATERTELRVLYDDTALYVGLRLFDGEPTRIQRRLSSRDAAADADSIQVWLDPLHDHFTGAHFSVSAAGVQRDAIISNDTSTDYSWDGVWESAVALDETGWSAELRIPFSQLRFARGQSTWGLNASRFIHRKNETSWLELVPKNENGLASRMAHLMGLDAIEPRRHLQLLPYAATRAELIAPVRSGDPFNDGSRAFGAAGIDVKWGLSSNLTVDGTINPDFGQVEVDPAVVNLTAFETFFAERRPFFVEGAQIFTNFGSGGSNNNININFNEPRVFHSRRIGRIPPLSPSADFVDQVFGTTIVGAAKLTGKTANGWSIGLLEAVTAREDTRVDIGGRRDRVAVEPRTNYVVGRLQRDLNPRATIGLLATGVVRDLDTPLMRSSLPEQAWVAGGDGHLFLDRQRDWVVNGKLSVSHVSGSSDAILRLQQASQRYFQRPDAGHIRLDPTRRTLTGIFGRTNLNRNSGRWQVNASLYGASPGYDVNDVGFNTMSDRAGAHAALFWRKTATDRWTRYRQFAAIRWWSWNYGRELQNTGWLGFWSMTFLNYWNTNGTFVAVPRGLDDRLTRGGPSTEAPGGANLNFNLNTDSRTRLYVNGNVYYSWSDASGWSRNHTITVTVKPLPSVTISTGPYFHQSRTAAQYLRTTTDATAVSTFGRRYVFGGIDQTQVTMTTRASVIVSPRMSIQVFMQPLLAVGDYTNFKELSRPRTFDFVQYGAAGSLLSYDDALRRYTADPDGAGAAPAFSFSNPDFNFKSLRMNTVFRWELRPGSNLYAVWTRQQQDFANPGEFRAGRDASALFTAPADDVFLIKMAYWLGR